MKPTTDGSGASLLRGSLVVAVLLVAATGLALAAEGDSRRLSHAKDLIADEQWSRAVAELRIAAADPAEKSRDEVLYWLAHSLNQSGDSAAALETIQRLEREFPSSLWVKPARSLRLDIAVHLQRDDVLWWTALPPPAPPSPPLPPSPLPPPSPPPAPRAATARPPAPWFVYDFTPDLDLRIQALGSLISTQAERVIPLLGEIALTSGNDTEARRAVFVLAQSRQPDAQATVVRVAKTAAEPVRIAAVRELGRFGGPDVSRELLQVYATADQTVKRQVVSTLGDRSDRVALFTIAQSETDQPVRNGAIVALGRAGGSDQLRQLYAHAAGEAKAPIIVALFDARAEEDLIRIAEHETNPALKEEAIKRLRLMNTPGARAWLQKAGLIR